MLRKLQSFYLVCFTNNLEKQDDFDPSWQILMHLNFSFFRNPPVYAEMGPVSAVQGDKEKQQAARGGGTVEKLECDDHDQHV